MKDLVAYKQNVWARWGVAVNTDGARARARESRLCLLAFAVERRIAGLF